jgi:hypothetical protein
MPLLLGKMLRLCNEKKCTELTQVICFFSRRKLMQIVPILPSASKCIGYFITMPEHQTNYIVLIICCKGCVIIGHVNRKSPGATMADTIWRK